ncbi:Uncharacterised protein [Morganella morganii]|nr:Uncharacterised protein [Morganella morganii]
MGQGRPVRVEAALITFDFQSRETVLINRKPCHLNLAERGFQRNRGKAARTAALFFIICDVFIGQIDDFAQLIQYIRQVSDLLRYDFELINRSVFRQQSASAVINHATAWRNRNQFYPVIIGTGLIIFMAVNLEMIEIHHQYGR